MDFAVTRGLLVGPTPQGRYAEERRILAEHFPGFSQTGPQQAGVAAGRLTTFANQSYMLRIVLPADYPNTLPAIVPDGWKPMKNPHIYTNGNMCVMKPNQWHAFMSIAFLVAKSALWLNKYEIFVDRAIWPGAEQHPHGPIYRLRKWANEL